MRSRMKSTVAFSNSENHTIALEFAAIARSTACRYIRGVIGFTSCSVMSPLDILIYCIKGMRERKSIRSLSVIILRLQLGIRVERGWCDEANITHSGMVVK